MRTLNLIQIRQPCPVDWDSMDDRAAGRFCQQCQKTVHNFSSMTTAQIDRLVTGQQRAGDGQRLCVRMERDAAGAIKTLDYAPPAQRTIARRWTPIVLTIGLSLVLNWAMKKALARPSVPVVMSPVTGRIAMPPPPPPANFVMGDMAVMGEIATTQPATTQPGVLGIIDISPTSGAVRQRN